MVKSYITENPLQTRKLGEKLAKEIFKKKTKKAIVVGLTGELGSGKTTFLQGFAWGLGVKERVLSPTFVLMRKFKYQEPFSYFYHIDCYRVKGPKELSVLRFKEITSTPGNIIAIEWADRIKKALPKSLITLKFAFIGEKTRKITFKSP